MKVNVTISGWEKLKTADIKSTLQANINVADIMTSSRRNILFPLQMKPVNVS